MKRIRRGKPRLLVMTAAVFLFGAVWRWGTEVEAGAHRAPVCKKVSLEQVLKKEPGLLKEEDYALLFQQTGLGKAGVDALFDQGRQRELPALQARLFAPVEVECRANTIVTREERIAGEAPFQTSPIPHIEEGDILLTFNCHALGWRNGHAALVVDAGKRLTLEASQLGVYSQVGSMEHWETYPSFVVLRLRGATQEERAAIAEYARQHLSGLPYRLEAGILDRAAAWLSGATGAASAQASPDTPSPVTGTHCAHLTWYAYRHFGYDLDSNRGVLVTPRDIFESSIVEIVQIYGMEAP